MEYLIVIPIEEMPLGRHYEAGESLPLHTTVLHWFIAGEEFKLSKFVEKLQRFSEYRGKKGITLVSQAPALFGSENNVPCHRLMRDENLLLLHTAMFRLAAEAHSTFVNLSWVGAGYNPHVTTVDGRAFTPGSTHTATHIAFIQRGTSRRKIVRYSFPL